MQPQPEYEPPRLPQTVLDAGGETWEVLRPAMERCMADIAPGEVLEVISGDREAWARVPAWCALTRHLLVLVVHDGEETRIHIEKHRGSE